MAPKHGLSQRVHYFSIYRHRLGLHRCSTRSRTLSEARKCSPLLPSCLLLLQLGFRFFTPKCTGKWICTGNTKQHKWDTKDVWGEITNNLMKLRKLVKGELWSLEGSKDVFKKSTFKGKWGHCDSDRVPPNLTLWKAIWAFLTLYLVSILKSIHDYALCLTSETTVLKCY